MNESVNKCLSLSDTKVRTDAVGAPETTAALVVKALGFELIGFHEKVLPFLIVAINCSPKLSKDQEAGSNTTELVIDASPQAVKKFYGGSISMSSSSACYVSCYAC